MIERIVSEYRRRTKTQGLFPTPEAMVTVVCGQLATRGIRVRKVHGYKTMARRPLRQAA